MYFVFATNAYKTHGLPELHVISCQAVVPVLNSIILICVEAAPEQGKVTNADRRWLLTFAELLVIFPIVNLPGFMQTVVNLIILVGAETWPLSHLVIMRTSYLVQASSPEMECVFFPVFMRFSIVQLISPCFRNSIVKDFACGSLVCLKLPLASTMFVLVDSAHHSRATQL